MSGAHIRDPITHGLVNRFLQCGLTGRDRNHLRAEKFHSLDIQGLTLHIDGAHVDDALATEPGRNRCRGNAVLTRASFGNDSPFAHPLGEQNLTKRVVNFMRAGMKQILPFEINFGAAEFLRQAFGEIERRGATGKIAQQSGEFILKRGIVFGAFVFLNEFVQGRYQRFRNEHSAVNAEVTACVRHRFNHAIESRAQTQLIARRCGEGMAIFSISRIGNQCSTEFARRAARRKICSVIL